MVCLNQNVPSGVAPISGSKPSLGEVIFERVGEDDFYSSSHFVVPQAVIRNLSTTRRMTSLSSAAKEIGKHPIGYGTSGVKYGP